MYLNIWDSLLQLDNMLEEDRYFLTNTTNIYKLHTIDTMTAIMAAAGVCQTMSMKITLLSEVDVVQVCVLHIPGLDTVDGDQWDGNINITVAGEMQISTFTALNIIIDLQS